MGTRAKVPGSEQTETSSRYKGGFDHEPENRHGVCHTVRSVVAGNQGTRQATGTEGLTWNFNEGTVKRGVAQRKMKSRAVWWVVRLHREGDIWERTGGTREGLQGNGVGVIGGTEIRKKGVIGNNKEERRKRTTLLNAPLNGNITGGGTPKKGANSGRSGGANPGRRPSVAP